MIQAWATSSPLEVAATAVNSPLLIFCSPALSSFASLSLLTSSIPKSSSILRRWSLPKRGANSGRSTQSREEISSMRRNVSSGSRMLMEYSAEAILLHCQPASCKVRINLWFSDASMTLGVDSAAVSIVVVVLVELTNTVFSICQFNQYIYKYWSVVVYTVQISLKVQWTV